MSIANQRPSIEWKWPDYGELVLSIVIIWGFGDIVSTLVASAAAGTFHLEANPLIRALLMQDPMLMIGAKATIVLVVGLLLLAMRPIVESVPAWRGWFIGINAFGGVIVLSNVTVAIAHLL
ncbi:MAG: DUF5658 family protein [Halococcoides sp.]